MTNLIQKRILAFTVDYIIIAIYAILLYLVVQLVYRYTDSFPATQNPFSAQVIGFITLTLPVFLYSFLLEKSNWRGTWGKKLVNLQVVANDSDNTKRLIVRNILKYLPWEVAHTGVHWLIYYSNRGTDIPLWTWAALLIPQAIVIAYFISVILYKGNSSIYDKIAKTRISVVH